MALVLRFYYYLFDIHKPTNKQYRSVHLSLVRSEGVVHLIYTHRFLVFGLSIEDVF